MQISSELLQALQQCVEKKYEPQYTPTWARNYALNVIAPDTKRGLPKDFWVEMDYAFRHDSAAIVFMDGKRIYVRGAVGNRAFARHLGENIKAGKQVYFVSPNLCALITPENWGDIWSYLTSKCDDNYDHEELSNTEVAEIRVSLAREKMFRESAKSNRYQKIGKRGYNTSFDEWRAAQRTAEYERALRETVKDAKEILGAL